MLDYYCCCFSLFENEFEEVSRLIDCWSLRAKIDNLVENIHCFQFVRNKNINRFWKIQIVRFSIVKIYMFLGEASTLNKN